MGILKEIFGDGRPMKEVRDRQEIFGYNEAQPASPISEAERMELLANAPVREIKQFITHGPTVADIHNDFYTEGDRLLAAANIREVIKIQDEAFEKKAKTMLDLGFASHPDVSRYRDILRNREGIETSNKQKSDLSQCISYFQQKYPNHKFITMEAIEKLCNKYSLSFGPIYKYIGEIPSKNLEHMASFNIDVEDKAYIKEQYGRDHEYELYSHNKGKIAPWLICAPVKDFDMRNSHVVKGQIRTNMPAPLDPVVIQPVKYGTDRGYNIIGGLIITAWGDEASDPNVVNQKMN